MSQGCEKVKGQGYRVMKGRRGYRVKGAGLGVEGKRHKIRR